jgi:hypothetical protein
MLSGPQIDPGFRGVLCVRLINLAPNRITLARGASFLTTQFFRLEQPVGKPYSGPRQGQTGLSPKDIEELANTEGMTLGQVIKTLSGIAIEVGEMKSSVNKLVWMLPVVVLVGIIVNAVILAVQKAK